MKIKPIIQCIFFGILLGFPGIAFCADTDIKLNSLGFLPDKPKTATITAACSTFEVKNASDGKSVYSGNVTGPKHQEDVNQDAWIADFSTVQEKGLFYLDIPGVGRSVEFQIDDHVYNKPYYTAMRAFYLWRCGTAVEGTHNGIHYSHDACHMEDAWQDYIGNPDSRRDGTGGWHDAGDFGKYTVNAGVTMGMLFLAWEHFGEDLNRISLDLPETAAGWPDFLEELKWETDWLLKMQYPDGSGRISHKLTRLNFSGFIMPETDSEKRYYSEWGSAATADFAAIMAMAARHFKPYDAEYAKTCLDAAVKSYDFLKNNPDDKRPDLRLFSTGGYGTSDSDDRLWAAAELWQTTQEEVYLKDFEQRAQAGRGFIDIDWDWGNVRNLGMLTYIMSDHPGRDQVLAAKIKTDLVAVADKLVAQAQNDVYARPLGSRYYWGCNGTVARQVVLLQAADQIESNPAYQKTALDAVGHLFGRNYYGRSYVTGLGHHPPMNPHDRRSGADGIADPWPGYVVGGGHSATNWTDVEEDYRTNEIAVNWQAALVYALAGFVSPSAN